MEKDVDKRDRETERSEREKIGIRKEKGGRNGARRGSSLRRRFHESSHFNVR